MLLMGTLFLISCLSPQVPSSDEQQNLLPQNRPLWQKDCFELIFKEQQPQENL